MILKINSSANSKQAVRALNLLLGLGNYQTFTANTQASVKAFQKQKGLTVDGIAGPKTLTALANTLPEVKYKDYSGSVYVKAVQALVGASVDGKYGSGTRANVMAFQSVSGLETTGSVAKNDWLALWDCSYTRTAKTSGTNTVQASGAAGLSPQAQGNAQDAGETRDAQRGGATQPVDYKQYDSRWKSKQYSATGSKSQTIGSSGCGPTSMADIMATWIDKKITPVEMCQYALKHGYRTANSGTAWGFFKSVATAYGFRKFVQTKAMATARAALKEGALVVASMGPGYWTSGGHYICLWKTDETYMYANDPASSTRKKQKLKAFEEQRKQFFIFYR